MIAILWIPVLMFSSAVVPTGIVDGAWDVPDHGVGWLQGYTRVVLVGHTPGVFEDLDQLEVGDRIILLQPGEWQVYEVSRIWLTTDLNRWPLSASDKTPLLLVTCEGENNEARRIIGADLVTHNAPLRGRWDRPHSSATTIIH